MHLQNKTGQNVSTAGQLEIVTQRRAIAFFQEELGYAYRGHWKDRPDNCYDEQALPTGRPKGVGHSDNDELQNKKVYLQNKCRIKPGRT